MIHSQKTIDQETRPSHESIATDQAQSFVETLKKANGCLIGLTSEGAIYTTNGVSGIQTFSDGDLVRIGISNHQIAICTSTQLKQFTAFHDAAPRMRNGNSDRPDGAYFERVNRQVGAAGITDIAWTHNGWCIASSLFSCLAIFDEHHSFVPIWQPPFVSTLLPEDRCHLSGVAIVNQKPAVVSCYSTTDVAEGWKQGQANSGVLINVETNQIICRGLNAPSSPRFYDDRIWFVDQSPSRLMMLDNLTSQAVEVAQVPGRISSLAFVDGYAIAGSYLESSQESQLIAIELSTGKCTPLEFSFKSELLDLHFLPQVTHPTMVTASPETSHWVLPQPKVPQRNLDEEVKKLSVVANQLHERGQLDKAADCYNKAITFRPAQASLHNNLGNVYQQANQKELAIQCYERALELKPNFVASLQNLGYLLREEGKVNECQEVFQRAQKIESNPIINLLSATAMPPIYDSLNHLNESRGKLVKNIDQLANSSTKIDVTTSVAPTNFYSVYHGKNDIELQTAFGKLFDAPQPKLSTKPRSHGKIKIGFVSRYFRNHTIGRLNLGLIEQLPKDDFEIVLISFGNQPDEYVQRFQKAADHYLDLPANLEIARSKIIEQDLDVLLFADVGMDPFATTLARSRLAPKQGLTWGHPTTSGMPSMDFFLSSEHLETPESDQHYTEQLIRLPNVNSYYFRPNPPAPRSKSYFGLSEESNIYLCFQNLFKIHPDFDEVFCSILEQDSAAQIVLMQGRYPHWTNLLQRRFERTLGSHSDRVVFLPSQSHEDFLALNKIAEVSLDPIHFGGGNTSYEAFAMGLPVVTLPSEFLRCRITYALYQQLQVDSCIANSLQGYAEIALKLGTDPKFRESVSNQILSRCGQIFEDPTVVPAFVAQIQSICQLSNGEKNEA